MQISTSNHKQLKHLLTGEEFTQAEIQHLLDLALDLKKNRKNQPLRQDLAGKHLALLFDKASLRTRVSFTVAMRELGGDVVESVENTRKTETPFDQAKVLSGYCHGIMIRTHADKILQEMSTASSIPIINGLSELHHPCQIFSDLLTLQEKFGNLKNLTLTYIGDGNNILHSILLLMPMMGVNVNYCCPATRQPHESIVKQSLAKVIGTNISIKKFTDPNEACVNADAVYTDVWTSMGYAPNDESIFNGFQVNEKMLSYAKSQAVFMHCLPMERGKEVSSTLPDSSQSIIFQQSENRLHLQKALLLYLL